MPAAPAAFLLPLSKAALLQALPRLCMPLVEGFLCKQGSGRGIFEFKTWKVRWCVVDYGSIKFYNSESQVNELRNYSLTGSSLISYADSASHGAPYEFVFIIHFSPEAQSSGSPPQVVLCVETLEEMQSWVSAVKTADSSALNPKIAVDEPWSWLSIEEIKSLATMLSCDAFSPIFAFSKIITPSQSSAFIDHTLTFLFHSGDLSYFISTCIEQLIAGQVESTLFRENGVYLRFIVGFMCLTGQDYLKKVVEPHIAKIVQEPSLELDPVKASLQQGASAASGSELQALLRAKCSSNQSKVEKIISALLVSIDGAELPHSITKVLYHIASLVNRDFPNFLYSGVVNVFFLRFIVASLCSPCKFGMFTEIQFDASQSRNLSVTAKVLQNIANGIVENKKEPFMQPLSSFVQEQQIFMIKFLSKVLRAGTLLAAAPSSSCAPSSLPNLSKKQSQDLQTSCNWWVQLIHKHATDLPPEVQTLVSLSDSDMSSMRDTIRGQLANWSSFMDGKLVYTRPLHMSSLIPTIFVGDAFLIASFDCWCKVNRALMHGTLYITRSAFVFIASVFNSVNEVLVMRLSNMERITKVNFGDAESLVQLDMNRPFFDGMHSGIRLDFMTDSGSLAFAILFDVTVDSSAVLPIDGSVDSSGKKTFSIFAAMYSLLSLAKNRQEAERKETATLPTADRTDSPLPTSKSFNRRISGASASKRFSASSSQACSQLQALQDFAKMSFDDSSSKGLSSQRVKSHSIRSSAECLLRHIHTLGNCYETSFTGTRFISREPPIFTRADWDAISPFIWCSPTRNPSSPLYFPHALLQRHGFKHWRECSIPRPLKVLLALCE
jgi:hypothetical protein